MIRRAWDALEQLAEDLFAPFEAPIRRALIYLSALLLLRYGVVVDRYGSSLLYVIDFAVSPPSLLGLRAARVSVRRVAGVWRWLNGDPFPSSLAPRLSRLVQL